MAQNVSNAKNQQACLTLKQKNALSVNLTNS